MNRPEDAGDTRRQRSLRFGQATLLVIVAIVISCCGFGANALRPQAIATPTPTHGTAPITGSVVLGADGHTIYYTDPDGGCRLFSLSADRPGEGIQLSLSYSTSEFCVSGDNVMPTATLQLAVPDVSQPIVDAVSGRSVPAFRQAGALHPSRLPVGTNNTTSLYGNVASAVPTFDGAGAATMAETFANNGSASGRPDGSQLWIVQSTGPWSPPPGTTTTAITVRGHAGRAAPGIIVWQELGVTVAIFWTFIQAAPMPSTASLTSIANDLVRTATT